MCSPHFAEAGGPGPIDACGVPVSDSRDGTPRGYHILSVDGNSYTTRFVAARDGEAQLRVLIEPAFGEPIERNSRVLIVDVFDGGPKTVVRCEINCGETIAMPLSRVAIADPYIIRTFDAHRQSLKPWVAATASSHIWSAELPPNLGAGTFACSVHVTDEYGRTYSVTQPVELAA